MNQSKNTTEINKKISEINEIKDLFESNFKKYLKFGVADNVINELQQIINKKKAENEPIGYINNAYIEGYDVDNLDTVRGSQSALNRAVFRFYQGRTYHDGLRLEVNRSAFKNETRDYQDGFIVAFTSMYTTLGNVW